MTETVRLYDPSEGIAYRHTSPAMPAYRVPVVWGQDCRYCRRYSRACGRHDDTTRDVRSLPLPSVPASRSTIAR